MNVETLTAHGSLIHGMLSSLITIPLCHPLFTVKTRRMTGQGFPPLREVYRCYGANQFCDVNYVAVAYLANNFFTKTIMQGKELNTAELFLGGFFMEQVIWPEYLEYCKILDSLVNDIMNDLISKIHCVNDADEIEIAGALPLTKATEAL